MMMILHLALERPLTLSMLRTSPLASWKSGIAIHWGITTVVIIGGIQLGFLKNLVQWLDR